MVVAIGEGQQQAGGLPDTSGGAAGREPATRRCRHHAPGSTAGQRAGSGQALLQLQYEPSGHMGVRFLSCNEGSVHAHASGPEP